MWFTRLFNRKPKINNFQEQAGVSGFTYYKLLKQLMGMDMNKLFSSIFLTVLMGLQINCANQRLRENRDFGISATELQAKLNSPQVPLLIDVRTSDEYYAGHLPGARLFPANDIFMNVHQLPPEQEIILYCSDGQRSLLVAKHLRAHGFGRVKRLNDGVKVWPGTIER